MTLPLKSATALDVDTLLLVVVGAHLMAEIADRPLAQRVTEMIAQWQAREAPDAGLRTVICTDLWYLNDRDLISRPAIIIGDPAVNAAAAYFANRLPTAFVIEGVCEVQMDVELIDLHACLWGSPTGANGTAAAIEAFAHRYLDGFLRAAHDAAPSPEAGIPHP